MRELNRLSALKVARLTKPGLYGDGRGLWLRVASGGTKAWVLRFMLNGRARAMGLGPIDRMSLAKARERARDARKLLLDGSDPIEHRCSARRQARLEAALGITFKECAERHIASHETSWRNPKHRAQWRSTLATYAYPALGELPVAAIDTGLVLQVLEPLWRTKTETASRLRGRIEAVLDWATAREHRRGDNPARWRGHLDKLLPSRRKVASVRHHAALPYVEIPAFMEQLRGRDGVAARALELLILTGTRTSEVVKARWDEIELGAREWVIPAERMKAGREHRVPLSDRAVDLLQELPREAEFVFPGGKAMTPLSNMALLGVLRRMGRADLTSHGFRSSFRDWAAEQTNYPNHVVEMALAHAIGDRVEAAYRRGDLFAKRKRLMQDWARYCVSSSRDDEDRVVTFRGSVHG